MSAQSSPKVTVVVPVYNVAKYLRACMDAIVHQTLTDIQIICVNDGSSDESLSILREYEAKDGRIFIIDKTNGGISSARNAAFPHIRGKYTLFVDSDDIVDLEVARKTYYRAEETQADMVVFYHDIRHDGSVYTKTNKNLDCLPIGVFDTLEDRFEKVGLEYTYPWCKLLKTSCFLDNGIVFPEGLVFEDLSFHWMMLVSVERIAVLPERLYHYQRHPGSISAVKNHRHLDMIAIFDVIRDFLVEKGLFTGWMKDFYVRTRVQTFGALCGPPYRNRLGLLPRHFAAKIRAAFTEEDIRFLQNDKTLRTTTRNDLYELMGMSMPAKVFNVARTLIRGLVRPIERRLKAVLFRKKMKGDHVMHLRVRELSDIVCRLSEECVALRGEREAEKHLSMERITKRAA